MTDNTSNLHWSVVSPEKALERTIVAIDAIASDPGRAFAWSKKQDTPVDKLLRQLDAWLVMDDKNAYGKNEAVNKIKNYLAPWREEMQSLIEACSRSLSGDVSAAIQEKPKDWRALKSTDPLTYEAAVKNIMTRGLRIELFLNQQRKEKETSLFLSPHASDSMFERAFKLWAKNTIDLNGEAVVQNPKSWPWYAKGVFGKITKTKKLGDALSIRIREVKEMQKQIGALNPSTIGEAQTAQRKSHRFQKRNEFAPGVEIQRLQQLKSQLSAMGNELINQTTPQRKPISGLPKMKS